MSSHLVQEQTINRVVGHLQLSENDHWTRDKLKSIGLDDPKALAQAMKDLNIQALRERYGDSDGYAEEGTRLVYRFYHLSPGRFQALKSLRCWLYQCSEGNVPESGLFKIMDDLAGAWAQRIVESMPEYEKASWDFRG